MVKEVKAELRESGEDIFRLDYFSLTGKRLSNSLIINRL